MLKHWRLLWLAIYCVAVWASLLRGITMSELVQHPQIPLFLIFAVLPIALLSFGVRWKNFRGVVAVMLGLVGVWAFSDGLNLSSSDGQAGMIIFLIPILQLCVAAPAFLVTQIVDEHKEPA